MATEELKTIRKSEEDCAFIKGSFTAFPSTAASTGFCNCRKP